MIHSCSVVWPTKTHPIEVGCGTGPNKLKPNPNVYWYPEYQLQGESAEAIKKLVNEFIERG